jgi:uncharacterized protein
MNKIKIEFTKLPRCIKDCVQINLSARGVIYFLCFTTLFGITSVVQAASFDCKKAASTVENLICKNPDLSKQDEQMSKLYQDDYAKSNDTQKQSLLAEQKHWLKLSRNVCKNETCIKIAYWSRLSELDTFFAEKSPLYEHESDKAESIKQILVSAPFHYAGWTDNKNDKTCHQMFEDIKVMKGLSFIDPVAQTQSYEDPVLDEYKHNCTLKPSLNFGYACLPAIAANLSNGENRLSEALEECDVSFGLPPFKIYELPPNNMSEKVQHIMYSDDAYGPVNWIARKPHIGGGFSGFRQVDLNSCEQSSDIFAQSGSGQVDQNFNSVFLYKEQYYFMVLIKEFDTWWMNISTITKNGARNQKVCGWNSTQSN